VKYHGVLVTKGIRDAQNPNIEIQITERRDLYVSNNFNIQGGIRGEGEMKSIDTRNLSGGRKVLFRIYIATFILMAFTGFGQMPIFKRYYVSDIPGMGWSADFYLTHYIHYIGAIFLLGLLSYVIMDFILSGRKEFSLTYSAYVRIAMLGGIIITGIFRVLKNLPDVVFSPGFTLFIDISHLGFMMLYLLMAVVFLIMKSGWVVRR